MVDLSIIVLSYNTRDLTKRCIDSLIDSLELSQPLTYQIIVVDNDSSDGSQEMIKSLPVESILLNKNIGYGKANNVALTEAKGKYILYLNSDVIHENVNYSEILSYMNKHKSIGALTVKVMLDSKRIDPASHRGFPTVWRSFTYFTNLEKLFGTVPLLNRLFGGYHATYEDLNEIHQIEAITGAFFLGRTHLLKKLEGFDEDFFMYGEDLDLAYRIKELGYKIMYYPRYHVLHLKYQSGIKTDNHVIRSEIKRHFYQSMWIFYEKHYIKKYPSFITKIVYTAIKSKMKQV